MVTSLVLQHQARARLREQDDSLRQQQSQMAALQADSERLSKLTAGGSLTSNQPEDLQRLRAEAAALRQQTGAVTRLREENRRLKASAAKPQTPLQAREEAMVRMGYSKQWTLAFMMYAEDNKGQLPIDFEQAKAFVDREAKADMEASADQFEVVCQGKWRDIKNPGKVVVLREKQAHQMPDGRWAKVYGFADGHSELHSEADGNFEAWEKERIIAPAAPSQ